MQIFVLTQQQSDGHGNEFSLTTFKSHVADELRSRVLTAGAAAGEPPCPVLLGCQRLRLG